ncbi:hypothetical protein HanRHA438_Chr04g0191271 [Helianthus annuus]|nr:hypothetical protein HanRHA438_Chr04g0191271 [Helianthus annuus]
MCSALCFTHFDLRPVSYYTFPPVAATAMRGRTTNPTLKITILTLHYYSYFCKCQYIVFYTSWLPWVLHFCNSILRIML